MPVDPEIPLGVKFPSQGENPMTSALGTVGKFADIQNSMNQNKLFQQTMQARRGIGEILASSPDLDTALKTIQGSPLAAYLPEVMSSLRQSQLTQVQMQGAVAEQAGKSFDSFLEAIPQIAVAPEQYDILAKGRLEVTSPLARGMVENAIKAYKDSLFGNLSKDPEQADQQFKNRAIGGIYAAGHGKDVVEGLTGENVTIPAGGHTSFGVKTPAAFGGEYTPKGIVQHTLSPQVTTGPGGVPIILGGGGGGRASSSQQTSNPLGVDTSARTSASASASTSIAGDGKALLPNPSSMISPSAGRSNVQGLQLLSPVQLKQAEKLQDHFSGDGQTEYNGAVRSMASLAYMNNALDKLAEGGGFLTPGSGANFRTEIAKGINTIAQMAGKEPPFDVKKIASIEEFNKETKRMGLDVLVQMFGASREASTVITSITSSVPGVENTYMGGKLVAAGLQASAQRVIDLRNFQNEWQAKNQGNLIGSAEAFNNLHPAQDYAKAVLEKAGLNARGFVSAEARAKAVKMGYLSKDMEGGPGVDAKPSETKTRRPLGEFHK